MSVVFRCLMLLALLGAPAWAQDSGNAETTEGADAEPADGANADGLSLGVPDIQVGQTYSDGSHGDWEIRCVKAAEGNDPCQMYQLLKDEQGNSVAEIGPQVAERDLDDPVGVERARTDRVLLGRHAEQRFIAAVEHLVTPQRFRLAVDGGQARLYPYRFCAQVGAQRYGCIARLGFTADEVESFKRGSAAAVTIHAAGKPGDPVNLTLSLTGFTAGWASITARNAAAE